MRRISLVHAGFSAVTFTYIMSYLYAHLLLLFNPVLLLPTIYLPLEIVLLAGSMVWSIYMFAYWFKTFIDGGLDE